MVTLLTVLRLPGIALLDIWWMDHSASSIPISLQLADIAESGFNLLLLVMVSIHVLVHVHHLIDHDAGPGLAAPPPGGAGNCLCSHHGVPLLIATQFVEDEGR